MGISDRTEDKVPFNDPLLGHDPHPGALGRSQFKCALKEICQPAKDVFSLLVGQVGNVGNIPNAAI